MSYSNSTTHYGLPLPTGSDKSLFTDSNQAFQDIDAAIYTAETVASDAATDITAIKATIVNLQNADITFQGDITNLKGRMTTVEGVASQNTTDIADVRSDAEDMVTAHNEPTATSSHAYAIGDEFIYNDVLYRATAAIAIGDTIVPNTNCAATNVMTEINQINSDLSLKADTSTVNAALALKAPASEGVKSVDVQVTITATHSNLIANLSEEMSIVNVMPLSNNVGISVLTLGGDSSAYYGDFVDNTGAPITTGTVTCRVWYVGTLS